MSAASLGRSAGLLLLSPSLNPFAPSDPQESAWDKAWRAAVSEILMARDAERRRKRGLMGVGACSELGT